MQLLQLTKWDRIICLCVDHSTKWVFRFVAVSRLLQKSRVRPAWRVCTILRSPSESWILRSSFFPTFWLLDSKALVCTILRSPYSSAKMWRRINYLDDSVDNIFAKEHFKIWTSSSYIDKDISLAIALIKDVTVHTFAFKKERKRFGHGRWIVNVKKTTS